jgi:hypothetical protein
LVLRIGSAASIPIASHERNLERHKIISRVPPSCTLERARRPHDPPHAGIDFVWDQPNVLPGRLRYAVQLSRLNPPLTQRVLRARNLPAFDGPQNASLVQASRRCGRSEAI